MQYKLLTVEEVVLLHDHVLNPGELEGLAGDKSLEGALGRIEFRLQYGMIEDVYDLAAVYAVAISQAHAFNDANKRTAYASLEYCLQVHNAVIVFDMTEVGDLIIEVAQGKVDEVELARWLRRRAV